jgi:hypothetical protein
MRSVKIWNRHYRFRFSSRRVLKSKGLPTKRAADWWDSSRLTGSFLASGFSCSQAESCPTHQRLTQTVRRFLLNCSKGVGLRREAMKKTEQQGSFLQVVFRVSTGSTCQVGQVGSLGGGGFGYLCCFQVRV